MFIFGFPRNTLFITERGRGGKWAKLAIKVFLAFVN